MNGQHHGSGHEQADRREALLGVVGELPRRLSLIARSGATIKNAVAVRRRLGDDLRTDDAAAAAAVFHDHRLPHLSVSFCAMMRASRSVTEPGG